MSIKFFDKLKIFGSEFFVYRSKLYRGIAYVRRDSRGTYGVARTVTKTAATF